MSAQAKVTFENGGDFIRETRREVDLYLQTGRTRLRADVQLYVKSLVAFAILAASWASLIFLHPGIVLGLVALAGLSLGRSSSASASNTTPITGRTSAHGARITCSAGRRTRSSASAATRGG
jgi:hypothetical protein